MTGGYDRSLRSAGMEENGSRNVNVRGVSVRLIDIIDQQVHINNVQGVIRIALVHILLFGETSSIYNTIIYIFFSLYFVFNWVTNVIYY